MEAESGSECTLAPDWMTVGSTSPYGFCLCKPLTDIIQRHTLGIPGMDFTSFHGPGQYLIKLASNLAQKLWQWSYSYPSFLALDFIFNYVYACLYVGLCVHAGAHRDQKSLDPLDLEL